jgi:hypothetical protein
MGKEWGKRWTETVNYLDTVCPVGLVGTHINGIVADAAKREAISNEILSLGWTWKVEPADSEDKRQAMRGLLLCQRVYYAEDTYAHESEGIGCQLTVDIQPCNFWYRDSRQKSVDFWRWKTVNQIENGIRMFQVVPTARAIDVQQAAYRGAPIGNARLEGNLKVSRSDTETAGIPFTCYVGIIGWLVRSGVVSMRWLMRNTVPNGVKGCALLFGEGRMWWNGPIDPSDHDLVRTLCKRVQCGHIVHIWSHEKASFGWNGHWVVANGDGTVCGVNNGEVKAEHQEMGIAVQKDYTKHSTLFEQLIQYSGPKDGGGLYTACMVVIDPMQMPNRI